MPATATAPNVGRNRAHVDRLWTDFRDAIDRAYAADKTGDAACLRDYARNVSWHDALDALVSAEKAAEREHRGFGRRLLGYPPPRAISAEHSARLLLLHNAADGAKLAAMPASTDWLIYRRPAVEATLLGYLVRAHVSPDWVAACAALDYAEAVK